MLTTLARRRRIPHPLGITIETPLLVPSFSSKGFGYNKAGQSEVKKIFEVASEYLTDTMLISAYDLANGHIGPIESAITEVTIIDSGGYEISDFHDLSAVYQQPSRPDDGDEWTEERLCKVYNSWPNHIPAIIVNFDRQDLRYSLQEQMERARKLFSNYRHQLHTLLVKPESEDQRFIQTKNVMAQIEELRDFDIIGFTEKELGNSILARMKTISNIRLAMDDAAVDRPIHVYGSLDPITSVLYFLAGAEIFDGLTWLRYGYSEGVACYYHNYGARSIGIDRTDDFVKAKTIQDNLSYLLDLKHQMQKFLLEGDFGKFGNNSDTLRESYDLLRTKNRRIQ